MPNIFPRLISHYLTLSMMNWLIFLGFCSCYHTYSWPEDNNNMTNYSSKWQWQRRLLFAPSGLILQRLYLLICLPYYLFLLCIIYLNICLMVLSSLNGLNACMKFLCLLLLKFTMLNLLKSVLNPLIVLNYSYLLNFKQHTINFKEKWPLNQLIFLNLKISELSK